MLILLDNIHKVCYNVDMIKESKPKLWQILAIWTTNFWRGWGNMYSTKLIWYCDDCKKKINGIKYEYLGEQFCEEHYYIRAPKKK